MDTRGRSRVSRALTYAVVVVLVMLDAFLMRPVLMLVLDEAELGSYIASFGLATAACVMAFYAGRLNAGAQGRGRRLSLVGSLLMTTWLLGGLFIAALRAIGASTATELSASTMTTDSSPVTLQSGLQAILFLVIYIAIGLLTMTDAKEDRSLNRCASESRSSMVCSPTCMTSGPGPGCGSTNSRSVRAPSSAHRPTSPITAPSTHGWSSRATPRTRRPRV